MEVSRKNAYEVICDRVQRHHEMAQEAFRDHSIEVLHEKGVYRHYVCSKGGSNIYKFNVVTFPGSLVVTGDCGDMIWQGCQDMFSWAPGAINSIDYFEEKVAHRFETKEFDRDVAEAELYDLLDDDMLDVVERKHIIESIEDCMGHLDDGEPFFLIAAYESLLWDGMDFPDFRSFSSNFLWCRDALLWFFKQKGMMDDRELESDSTGGE